MTPTEVLRMMDKIETGDQVFFGNSGGPVEGAIHWTTAPWRRLVNLFLPAAKRFFVAQHVGTVLHDDGRTWLVDS